MRKIHIIQSIIIAALTAATIYMYKTDIQLYKSRQPTMTPSTVAVKATPDTEKQQLIAEIEVLRQDNERLKWYLNTFFEPAQINYMKARGK